MSICYQKIDGNYVILRNGSPIVVPMQEVALCFDKDGILHKHGQPELVQAWYQHAVDAFRAGDFNALADNLVYIQGPFDLEDLNNCLAFTGYVLTLYAKIHGQIPTKEAA